MPVISTSSTVTNCQVAAQDGISLPRHRWYFFKEAFSPDLVKTAINDSQLKPQSVVVDPFCGSGTVPLTAVSEGHHSYAFEVNPFLAFVARTKLASPPVEDVRKLALLVENGIRRGAISSLEDFSTFTERKKLAKWLFNREVLRGFEGGRKATITSRSRAAELVRLCLIGAAMDCSNAAKDGKCLRYKPEWEKEAYSRDDLMSAFHSRMQAVNEDIQHELPRRTRTVYLADSRKSIDSTHLDRKFQLCVTSPPYLNSFDYTDVYRPELFLGKFVTSMKDLRNLRQRTVRSHVQAKWNDPIESGFGENYRESVSEILKHRDDLWNSRIPVMIQAYFEDMKAVLRRLRERADDGASAWIVVSTSSYAGIELPVDLIIADIGVQVGWTFREVSVVRYLRRVSVQQWESLAERKQGPYLRESVIILDANPKRSRVSMAQAGKAS